MKIYLVEIHDFDNGMVKRKFLVRAHTSAGAEKFVNKKVKPFIEARVPSQDDLIAALGENVKIEDATVTSQEPNDE